MTTICQTSTIDSIAEISNVNGQFHQYATMRALSADKTYAILDGGRNQSIVRLSDGAEFTRGVAGAQSWSPIDDNILWGCRTGDGKFVRRDFTNPSRPTEVVYYSVFGGGASNPDHAGKTLTRIQIGKAQGVVQGDQRVAIDMLFSDGTYEIVTLDLTQAPDTPATVIGRMQAPENYKWARINLGMNKILVLQQVPNEADLSNNFLTQYDLDFSNPLSMLATGHSDFVIMEDGKEWLFSLSQQGKGAQLVGENTTQFLPVKWPITSAGGHVSAHGSPVNPGVIFWGPSVASDGVCRWAKFDNNWNFEWEVLVPGYDVGSLTTYKQKTMGSVSQDGISAVVKSGTANSNVKSSIVTLDNSSCEVADPEPASTISAIDDEDDLFTVVELPGGGYKLAVNIKDARLIGLTQLVVILE